MKSGRIEPIDAARGCAMILVCLSHVRYHFDEESSLYFLLTTVTRIATPTFLLLSGFVAGYLLRTNLDRKTAVTLVDRGLFLLLVAHLFHGLAEVPVAGLFDWMFARASIPDAIGVALCIAPLLWRMSTRMLLALGATLCVVSWPIAMLWVPQHDWSIVLGRVLFNARSVHTALIDVSVVPYLGMFLLGMGLSAHLHRALLEVDHAAIATRLSRLGAIAVAAALAGLTAWHFGRGFLPAGIQESADADFVRHTLDPRVKYPPSPAYLLFYGGAGLLMAATFFFGKPKAAIGPIVRHGAVIGRASLMCFVLQDLLLFVVPLILGFHLLKFDPFWIAYVVFVIAGLYVAATLWGGIRGNRFFTIGLRALYRRQAARSQQLPALRAGEPAAR